MGLAGGPGRPSLLMINVGRTSSLWAVPPPGRWLWAIQEKRLNKAGKARTAASASVSASEFLLEFLPAFLSSMMISDRKV